MSETVFEFPIWSFDKNTPNNQAPIKGITFTSNFKENVFLLCQHYGISPHPDMLMKKSPKDIEIIRNTPINTDTKQKKTQQDVFARTVYDYTLSDIISISSHPIDFGTLEILRNIFTCSFITTLKIYGLNIEKETITKLSSYISTSPFMKILKLDYINIISSTEELVDYTNVYANFFASNNLLKFISMRGNKITDGTMELIASKFTSLITLKEIDLSYNLLTDNSIEFISNSMKYNKSLCGISIAHNNIEGTNLISLFTIYKPFILTDPKPRDESIAQIKTNFKEITALFAKRKGIYQTTEDQPPVMPEITPAKKDTEVSGNNTLIYINLSSNNIINDKIVKLCDEIKEINYPIYMKSIILNNSDNKINNYKIDQEIIRQLNELINSKLVQ